MKKTLLFSLAAAALAGCSSNTIGEDEQVIDMLPKTRAVELTADQRTFVKRNTDFSFNLFRTVSQMPQGRKSSILSPISVTYVMGMLNDGAAGNTAKEITSVIGFGEGNAQAVNEFCKKLIEEAPKTDPSVTLEIANTVVSNKHRDVKLESAFQKDMKNYYAAEVANLDFSKKTDALKSINGWCNKKTNGMIPEILAPSELSDNALLLLMNAIYFKATWTEKFDTKDTHSATFTTEGGQQKQLPMMHRKAGAYYSENEVCQMLNLPYGSGDMWSMKVLLPKEGKTVDDIISSLDAVAWDSLWHNGWGAVVDIDIPRFSTSFATDLVEPLKAMGAPSMFMPTVAEFPGVSSNYKKDLYVSLMKQKAAIDVSEEGTKASAVTVAIMDMAAAGPIGQHEKPQYVDFHAYRPFVYLIQESSTGVIFFLGTFRGE